MIRCIQLQHRVDSILPCTGTFAYVVEAVAYRIPVPSIQVSQGVIIRHEATCVPPPADSIRVSQCAMPLRNPSISDALRV